MTREVFHNKLGKAVTEVVNNATKTNQSETLPSQDGKMKY